MTTYTEYQPTVEASTFTMRNEPVSNLVTYCMSYGMATQISGDILRITREAHAVNDMVLAARIVNEREVKLRTA